MSNKVTRVESDTKPVRVPWWAWLLGSIAAWVVQVGMMLSAWLRGPGVRTTRLRFASRRLSPVTRWRWLRSLTRHCSVVALPNC